MEFHIFAVWDFMSLLKAMQNKLTCTDIPWVPSKSNKEVVRLINEIVLGEESDELPGGGYMDHFSLYLKAMKEVKASTSMIDYFLESFDLGKLPGPVKNFVSYHLELALERPIHEVMGAFFFGREDLIPEMFSGVLKEIKTTSFRNECPHFIYYLERHIELDGEEHSQMAFKCLEEVCGQDSLKWEGAYQAGIKSLELRTKLWDGVLDNITRNRSRSVEL